MQSVRATRWFCAAAAAAALVAGPVRAGTDSGAAEPDQQGPESPPAPGWIPRWDTYLGGFRQLDEIALDSPTAGWAVDSVLLGQLEHTVFVRIAQEDLRAVQTVTGLDVRGLAARGGLAFAAGKTPDGGAMYVFAPTGSWLPVAYTARALEAVSLPPSGPGGYAVGQGGTALRLDGVTWRQDAFPDRLADLRAVAALNEHEAWALDSAGWLWNRSPVGWTRLNDGPKLPSPAAIGFSPGGRGLALGGGALEFRSGQWAPIASPGRQATALAWAGETAVVAVDGGVSIWDGGAWSEAVLPSAPANAAEGRTDSVGAAGAAWMAAQREGTVVMADPTPRVMWPTTGGLVSIDAHIAEEAWAGGEVIGGGIVGSSPRDGRWNDVVTLPVGAARTIVEGVSLLAPGVGWAISASDPDVSSRIWELSPTGWSESSSAASWKLTDVQSLAPDEAWASGFGPAVRWNGDSWKVVEESPSGRLSGPLAMTQTSEGTDGWFGGWGSVVRLRGAEWLEIPLPGVTAQDRVLALGPDGGGGAVALADGHVFQVNAEGVVRTLPDPNSDGLVDLSVSPSGRVWVLADPEGLFLWDEAAAGWIAHPLGIAGTRIAPRAIQAMDIAFETGTRPPGWEGHDVWIAGVTPGVGRLRVETPTVQVWLPAVRTR